MQGIDIVIVSTADWDNPFWTNKQYVARELARRGHRVFYVNSLGLRQPSFNRADIGRLWRRLKSLLSRPKRIEDNLIVWSPVVIPLQRYALVRRINRVVLSAAIRFLTRRQGFDRPLLWTYNPLTLRLLDTSDYRFVVYHCVDEIKAQPDMPVEILEREERRLTARANVVFVTAPKLLETRRLWNENTWFFPNVADFAHFAGATAPETPLAPFLAGFTGPVIGFIGALSGYKVDFALIESLARARPDYQIVLVGKVGEGDPDTDVRQLESLVNVHFAGPAHYAELPGWLKGFTVAILPSRLNEYTANMFPMKFFEYLAAGKPVVATALPALADFSQMIDIADGTASFIEKVDRAIERTGADHVALRQRLASEYTYEARTEKMMHIVSCEMERDKDVT